MRFAAVAIILICGFVSSVFASSPLPGNVIFITVDGVRWQEFFGGVQKVLRAGLPRGTELFPALKASAARGELWIYGDGADGGTFRIGNSVAMSLPGYRGILSGEFEDRCLDNRHCANIDRETIFDGLIARGFSREDLAAFTSWQGLGLALEKVPGRIARDVAHDVYPPVASSAERIVAEAIAKLDRGDRPMWGARWDRYTYRLAKLYLDNHRPRFLYLSLLDSDEFAHRELYLNYTKAIRKYDTWIAELRAILAKMGEYGENTTIVLTTDHGRGEGALWLNHGKNHPTAFRTWAVVIPSPRLRAAGVKPRLAADYTQLDLRPTLEHLLGVPVTSDRTHPGKSLVTFPENR